MSQSTKPVTNVAHKMQRSKSFSSAGSGDLWLQVIGRECVVGRNQWRRYREIQAAHPIGKSATRARRCCCFPRVLAPDEPCVFWWKIFSRAWDGSYVAFVLPITLAFQQQIPDDGLLQYLNVLAGFIFLYDFFINLNTGFKVRYNVQQLMMMHRPAILSYYMSSKHFYIDLMSIAALPVQVLVLLGASGWWVENLRVLQLLQVLRLLKVWKALMVVQVGGYALLLYRHFSMSSLYLANILYAALMLLNSMASLWCWTAFRVGVHNSWLTTVGNEDLSEAPAVQQYTAALYFAMTTLSTTGYGDIVSHTTLERLMALIIMGAGACFFTFIISSFTTMLGSANESSKQMSELRSRLAEVDSWMTNCQLPTGLRHDIKEYYLQAWNPDVEEKYDVDYINGLPTCLKEDVADYLTSDILHGNTIFGVLGRDERRFIASHLRPKVLPAGHDLFKQGCPGGSLYILAEGEIECLRYNQVLEVVEAPALIGELVLLVDTLPQAKYREMTCRALQTSLVWELTLEDLKQAVVVYPHLYRQLQDALQQEISHLLRLMKEHDPNWLDRGHSLDEKALATAMQNILHASTEVVIDLPLRTPPERHTHPSTPPEAELPAPDVVTFDTLASSPSPRPGLVRWMSGRDAGDPNLYERLLPVREDAPLPENAALHPTLHPSHEMGTTSDSVSEVTPFTGPNRAPPGRRLSKAMSDIQHLPQSGQRGGRSRVKGGAPSSRLLAATYAALAASEKEVDVDGLVEHMRSQSLMY